MVQLIEAKSNHQNESESVTKPAFIIDEIIKLIVVGASSLPEMRSSFHYFALHFEKGARQV
jgi:hypothetical protein